jgi:hypothetical protein
LESLKANSYANAQSQPAQHTLVEGVQRHPDVHPVSPYTLMHLKLYQITYLFVLQALDDLVACKADLTSLTAAKHNMEENAKETEAKLQGKLKAAEQKLEAQCTALKQLDLENIGEPCMRINCDRLCGVHLVISSAQS